MSSQFECIRERLSNSGAICSQQTQSSATCPHVGAVAQVMVLAPTCMELNFRHFPKPPKTPLYFGLLTPWKHFSDRLLFYVM